MEHITTDDAAALTPDEIRRRISEYEWYHTIDLGHGIVTPGQYDLAPIINHYGIPASLQGRTVLDAGPAHGFFAFEFERRGAARVATAEIPHWAEHDASPVLRETIERTPAPPSVDDYHRGALGFAIQARRSRVERQFCNIYDLTPERVGTYDFVFCASVLLHLTDPLRALYGLRRVCRDEAIICTAIDTHIHVKNQPYALFRGTPTGQAFWFPTMKCLEQMALAAGFAHVEYVSTFSLRSTDGKFNTPHGTVRALVA
jgi:tRNA (mo5U34)-methyltransferase